MARVRSWFVSINIQTQRYDRATHLLQQFLYSEHVAFRTAGNIVILVHEQNVHLYEFANMLNIPYLSLKTDIVQDSLDILRRRPRYGSMEVGRPIFQPGKGGTISESVANHLSKAVQIEKEQVKEHLKDLE